MVATLEACMAASFSRYVSVCRVRGKRLAERCAAAQKRVALPPIVWSQSMACFAVIVRLLTCIDIAPGSGPPVRAPDHPPACPPLADAAGGHPSADQPDPAAAGADGPDPLGDE